ncbi:MAG: type IV pilus assembly protein PilP [Pseudohongiellaceae bacterium]|jgi:type IV pilus assembly protein PilP
MLFSFHKLRLLNMLGMTALLSACSGNNNFNDLQEFVDTVKARPVAQVEPVPVFVPYEGFIYSAASKRSPFDMPLVANAGNTEALARNVQPDLDRLPDALESQSLSELKMVGMLQRENKYEALVEDGFGEIHRVGLGSYLGRNYGKIQNISETQVNIVEIVPSGNGGWVERPQTLTLQ